MNKSKILIIGFILFSIISKAQNDIENRIVKWKNLSDYCEFLKHDVSNVFIYENCSYLGIFGKNNYKIDLRFDSVTKISDENYSVIGKSRLKGKVVGFAGEIKVERIELVHFYIERKELWLALVGTYNFLEDDKNGVFQGSFRKYIIYSWNDNSFSYADNHMELADYEGYAGVWKSLVSEKEYSCYFGFNSYPSDFAGDFDQGGEPNIDPKYKQFGWDSYFKQRGDYGFYTSTDCIDKWWEE